MKRAMFLKVATVFGAFGVLAIAFATPSGELKHADAAGPAAAPKPGAGPGDAPAVATLAPMLEGFRWGQTHLEVLNSHNSTGGIFDKDFDPQLVRVQPGVQQKTLESVRDNLKAALVNSWIEFKDTPKGYDSTGIRGEYSYRNHEALLSLDRNSKHRFFFFIGATPGERLWKIYDEVPLIEGGPLGKTFQEAVTKLQGALNQAGRVRAADPAQGIFATTVDWQDGTTRLRAVDRSNGKIVGIVLEERNTLNNLDRLRANKTEDPLAMDPSIAAITKGGISDPNGRSVAPAASSGAKPGTKPPKK